MLAAHNNSTHAVCSIRDNTYSCLPYRQFELQQLSDLSEGDWQQVMKKVGVFCVVHCLLYTVIECVPVPYFTR